MGISLQRQDGTGFSQVSIKSPTIIPRHSDKFDLFISENYSQVKEILFTLVLCFTQLFQVGFATALLHLKVFLSPWCMGGISPILKGNI